MELGSLFAGIGGIDIAFQNNGFNIKWANEIDNNASKTYKANFKHNLINDDIKNISKYNLSKVDILVGGFPCQAFSIAGYRKGFEDERGSIVFEMFKVLEKLRPEIIFLENVKNLLSHNDGATLKYLLLYLKKIGYYIKYQVLNTSDYSDIPQNRERVYIVGFLNENYCNNFNFPEKTTSKKSIKDILEQNVSEEFYYDKYKFYDLLQKEITREDTFYQWRRHYVRENKNNLCPTLTANMGTGGHNVPLIKDKKGIRKLTPRECARLQGFNDNYILPTEMAKSHLYKQIGNSVSIPVVEAVAQQIKKAVN